MATGLTKYADITALVADIWNNSLFALKEFNVIAPLVTGLSASGMAPRKTPVYGDANFRSVGEGEDVAATQWTKTLLSTLTPARHADTFFLTDQDMQTDPDFTMNAASRALGQNAAQYVDEQLADVFSSFTGTDTGTAGSNLTWAMVMDARATLQGAKVPGPYYLVVHPYCWNDLFQSAAISDAEFKRASAFQNRLTENYFVSSIAGDITIAVSNAVNIDASDDATNALFAREAIAYDERQAFSIEPERDASRQALELNASMWFATGVIRAAAGCPITADATAP